MRVSLGDARDKLSQIVQAALDGEQVTISRNGQPVADLVRTEHKKREAPAFGTLKGEITINDPDWHKGPETQEELMAWIEGRFD